MLARGVRVALPRFRRFSTIPALRCAPGARRAARVRVAILFCRGIGPIFTKLVDSCWFVFKIALVVVLLAAVGGGAYLYAHMDDEIRQHVETLLAERFPQLEVSVGGARLIEDRGIAVYDLELALPAVAGGEQRLVAIDELFLACDVQLTQLVQGNLQIQRVELKRPQAWLVRSPTGSWNFDALLPLPPCTKCLPPIVVRDGWLAVSDAGNSAAEPLVVRDVQATAAPQSLGGPQPKPGDPLPERYAIRIDGVAGGALADRAEFRITMRPREQAADAVVKLDQLHVGEALDGWIQPRLPAAARGAKITGDVSGIVTIAHALGGQAPPTFTADLEVSGGRIVDARLPRSLSDLAAHVVIDSQRVQVEQVQGKCGQAEVLASLTRQGWGPTAQVAAAARVTGMPLDMKLYNALPPMLRDQWDKYEPTGIAHADVQVRFDGQRWQPQRAVLTGEKLTFTSDKFRYRLTDGSGSLVYTPGAAAGEPARLAINMVGTGGGQPMTITGEVLDPRPGAIGWATISGRDVAIESAMIDALPDKPREVIRSMHPRGKFNFNWRLERTQLGQEQPNAQLQLELVDCAVEYEKFPYPLDHIRGMIIANNNHWRFTDLVSTGRRTVRCSGRLDPVPVGAELALQFSGQQVPLDDALFDALPPAVQAAWTELRLYGHVDMVADVFYRTDLTKPSVKTVVHPRPETAGLRPQFFDYVLEGVSGAVTYHDGQVALQGVRAQHGRTQIDADGNGYFGSDGGWRMELTGLSADRVIPNRELLVALPKQLSRLLEQLQPRGSFALHDGVLAFNKPASPLAPLETRWDFQLDCHQASIDPGVALENIYGTVRLEGQHDGLHAVSRGELNLDSVTFQDAQFTSVRSPLFVDETRCLLGRHATDIENRPTRRMTANLYDGQLATDAWVRYDGPSPQYAAETDVSGVSLERLVAERFGGGRDFRGSIDGNIQLRGSGRTAHGLSGEGHLHVRDASLYELPLLASLLKRIRTGGGDKTAFNECNINFTLDNQMITLRQLDFLGDVVNLYGQGFTGFDEKLALRFHAVVGRHDYHLPFVKRFVGEASQQMLEMSVAGTFAQPEVSTKALPGFSQFFEQLGADLRGDEPRQATRPFTTQ